MKDIQVSYKMTQMWQLIAIYNLIHQLNTFLFWSKVIFLIVYMLNKMFGLHLDIKVFFIKKKSTSVQIFWMWQLLLFLII